MVAGLATITPASGFVTIPAAFCIGLVAGVVCYFAVTKIKSIFSYDDSLDVFGVHGVGSIIGMLMLGFLANAEVNPAIATTFHGQRRGGFARGRFASVHQPAHRRGCSRSCWSGAGTFIILKIVAAFIGLRVNQEDESVGLDLSQHGERAYNE